MTTTEFSNEFDILYNNITSNQAPGLDEYEKSVFLTKAQAEVIKNYFNDRSVKNAQGFDKSQKRQYDFSTLLSSSKMIDYTDTLTLLLKIKAFSDPRFDSRSRVYTAPSDLFLSVNENVLDYSNRRYSVLPISYEEYNRLMLKPYGFPVKRQAWRLISTQSSDLRSYGSAKVINSINGNKTTVEFLFRNKYYKPLNITIREGEEDESYPPGVDETSDIVNIDLILPPKTPTADYWRKYLMSDVVLKGAKLDKYLYAVGSTTGLFPACEEYHADTVNIKIAPAVTETGVPTTTPIFELIGRFSGDITYNMRYVRTPKPIILDKLSDIQEGLSINGQSDVSECELPVDIHQEILQRAVELAKASYQGDINTIIQTGNASGTDIGLTASIQR